ncbi:bacteriohopanetetrol glucosamine biosynthesis glycosyltransferase HpnI [Rhodoligotrophos defluvii]|uniref:bacteriohopanetetrol glucosamine biosynthesis glycosyltransferase HpnI n=1 Tax=Rhodoligotrophos defluvii TaxID=2561934 RepID=UPI0014857361|nr:bacteriohopanetetrol glucosamine biosynthesis glycosyltransferase HpnI [Rhodoligotrophos defluvii]
MIENLHAILLLPVVGGSVFSLLCVIATARLLATWRPAKADFTPPVSILKPVYGLDRELEENLASFCRQDYPSYQLVLCVQRMSDPALPILRRVAAAYPDRVALVIRECEPTFNGKIQNIANGMEAARHDILVISDADVRVSPDYLRTIVAPLADPAVGYSCTLYRTADARTFPEKLELLSMNADFVPSLIFTHWTNSAIFCLGATVAARRSDIEAIGGLASLAEYLVEDQEMGRRLIETGKRMALIPMSVDIIPDYPDFSGWWRHFVYWDQNTKAANPVGFALTVLTRAVPFALLFACATGFSTTGWAVLLATVALRMASCGAIAGLLGDREVLRALWLLPLRDCLGLVSWAAALTKRTFVWRGHRFSLDRHGRIARMPDKAASARST